MMYLIGIFVLVIEASLVAGQIDTTNCTDYTSKSNTCKTTYAVTGIPDPTGLSVLAFFTMDPATYCSDANKEKFKKLGKCLVDTYRGCGMGDFQNLIPTGDSVSSAIGMLCDHKDDYQYTCLSNLPTCIAAEQTKANATTTPASDSTFEVTKIYYCQAGTFQMTCVDTDTTLKNCAKSKTQEILKDVLHELKPQACSAYSMAYTPFIIVASILFSLHNFL